LPRNTTPSSRPSTPPQLQQVLPVGAIPANQKAGVRTTLTNLPEGFDQDILALVQVQPAKAENDLHILAKLLSQSPGLIRACNWKPREINTVMNGSEPNPIVPE